MGMKTWPQHRGREVGQQHARTPPRPPSHVQSPPLDFLLHVGDLGYGEGNVGGETAPAAPLCLSTVHSPIV